MEYNMPIHNNYEDMRNKPRNHGFPYEMDNNGRRCSPMRRRSRSPRQPRSPRDLQRRVFDDFVVTREFERDFPRPSRGGWNDRDRNDRRPNPRDFRDDRRRDDSRNRTDPREHRFNDRFDDYYMERPRQRSRENERRDNNGASEPLLPPSSTIILQNIGLDMTERKIEDRVKADGFTCRHIAVIRDRDTGDNRGYAFVEFHSIENAEKWLKFNKRVLFIDDRQIHMNFSKSRKNDTPIYADWNCVECKALNFGSRKQVEKNPSCFRCGIPQKDSFDDNEIRNRDSKEDISKLEPCNVLMLRGMDFSTTEETIRMCISQLTSFPIYDVRLIKDKVTDMSRGFAFVEMGNTHDAQALLDIIERSNPPLEIENRRVTAGFARHGYNAPLASKANSRLGQSNIQTAASLAVAQGNASSKTEYSQAFIDSYNTPGQHPLNTQKGQKLKPPVPNQPLSSTYTFDAATGYYYDSVTELYYDPNSGYYYNATTGQYLFWNGARYQAVNQDGTPIVSNTATNNTVEAPPPPEKNEKDKVGLSGKKPKEARKIAKDMERWAKKMNTATQAKKVAVQQAQEELRMLEMKEEELRMKILHEKIVLSKQASTLSATVAVKENIRSLFVPDYEDDTNVLKMGSALSPTMSQRISLVPDIPDEDEDEHHDDKFIDAEKLACLLCKRQFPSKEVLNKHVQMSQLHKQNLANLNK
ncbi:RNA-binding protein 10 [Hydra vulgaris]|nr:RNA-binding protein 10 [Hydra vulgaris]